MLKYFLPKCFLCIFENVYFREDSVEQDQTAQSVQSDLGSTLSVSLLEYAEKIALKLQIYIFQSVTENAKL